MLASAVWILPAVFATVDQIGQRRLHGEPPASLEQLLWGAGDWLVYAIITPAVFWISSRWPLVRPQLARRGLVHLAFALLFCVAWALGGKVLEAVLAMAFDPDRLKAAINAAGGQLVQRASVNVLGWVLTTLPFGMVVYVCVAGMAHALQYFAQVREREVQMARLSEQLADARFAALQARLNPHFLFNTLNTIAVRARDGDTAGTVRMVEQLSDVLRRILSRHRGNEVPLAEELELVRQYLGIEQARFSDRLLVTFDVDDAALPGAVPGFALQHLVENAIRHGIAKRPGAGRLRVAARRVAEVLEVSVTDDGPGIDPELVFPRGHGLENTRERLRALYGERAALAVTGAAPEGTVATLRLPYREMVLVADVAEA